MRCWEALGTLQGRQTASSCSPWQGSEAAAAEGQKEQGWGTFFRIDSDGVNLLAVLLDHAEGDPAVLGVLLPALSAHPRQLLGHLDVRAGLGAVLLEGATQERLALHAGAAKQAATAHLCRGRGPLTWLCLWLGPAQAQAGLACPCPGGGGDPPPPPCCLRACHSHVSATGRGAAGAILAEGGLVSVPALAAVAVAGPAVAALIAAGVQAAVRRLPALAGAALVPGCALALPAVAFPTVCRGKTFQTRILQRARSPSLCPCLESITHPALCMPSSVGWLRRSCRVVRWDPGPPNPPAWALAGKGSISHGI